jgi:glutamate--cysteine ligase
VTRAFDSRLKKLAGLDQPQLARMLAGARRGVEKECLRIDSSGNLSLRPHPVALGSALTNRYITTDFSEALLEFVTPPSAYTWEALRALCDIHQFTYQNLGDELLWPTSMPCLIPADDEIPLARYGSSNVGTMKTVYRRGLGHRYGRHMQTIAGVHFNYSMPADFWHEYRGLVGVAASDDAFRSDQYLSLVRNFRRYGWLLLYLFGASPAMCRTFLGDRELDMPLLGRGTYYEPFGTSLRMSDLGYSNRNQSRINICLNSLDEYIRDLSGAIRTPEPAYERIGVVVDGEWQQLSANLLQIENEYYSIIRPKRIARPGERPTAALRRGGVEYVEVRALDISIVDPSGINQNTMRFIEAFLVYCLLEESPPLDAVALNESRENQARTARRGRDPDLTLAHRGRLDSLADWAREILAGVMAVAELIDRAETGDSYVAAVREMGRLVSDPDLTPSARILAELKDSAASFFEFGMAAARGHKSYFMMTEPIPAERHILLEREATESLKKQRAMEASDTLSFAEYVARYFANG